MTLKQIQHVVHLRENPIKKDKIHYIMGTTDGLEHPLWSMLNATFPPLRDWNRMKKRERASTRSAGDKLHKAGIPYGYYVYFLDKFSKGHLKRQSALLLTGHKTKKDGSVPILADYIGMMEYLITCYYEDPIVLDINDKFYERFPDTYKRGIYKYTYSVDMIRAGVRNTSARDVLQLLNSSRTALEFLETAGRQAQTAQPRPVELLDLDEGTAVNDLDILKGELQIRIGKTEGAPNPSLDKYFKNSGQLSQRGIRLLTGVKD